MSPVDGAVKCAVRVVLVEHVIFPLPLDKTIRIIHPIILRQEMEYRAVRIWRTLYVSIVYHSFLCVLNYRESSVLILMFSKLASPSATKKTRSPSFKSYNRMLIAT